MNTYLVGGAVRDKLLNKTPKDLDYVVVGSSPECMLAMGFKSVGNDFPVFLHPETGEEYALARTEKKIGGGYTGFETYFSPDVTIEDDLYRRDLTINAMAMDKNNNLIDPYNGVEDLKNHVLKHVSEHFSEDPVRVLRVARFAARYNYTIHPETTALMKEIVNNGEINHLTPERVWKEIEKAMTETNPELFWKSLILCDAIQIFANTVPEQMGEIYDYLPFIKHESDDRTVTSRIAYSFLYLDAKKQDKYKFTSEQKHYLNIVQKYHHKSEYQHLTTEEQLEFIKQTRALHDTNDAEQFIKDHSTCTHHNANDNISLLHKHISLLQKIDYAEITKISKENKIPIATLVEHKKQELLTQCTHRKPSMK